MARRSAFIHATVGALIAEASVWGVLLPWAHYRYTTGISFTAGLWTTVVLLALIGAAFGLATLAVKRAVKGR